MTRPGRVDRPGRRALVAKRWLAACVLGMVAIGCNLLVGIGDLPAPDITAPDGSLEASVDAADAADVRVDSPPGDAPVVDSGADSASHDGEAPDTAVRDADAGDSLDAAETARDGSMPPGTMTAVTAGANHTCALDSAGAVTCWGANDFGQLGNNSFVLSTTPVPVSSMSSGVKAIAAGQDHTCALDSAGAVYCWGWGGLGQLGNATLNIDPTPQLVQLAGGTTASAIAAGTAHTCALLSNGAVTCWGDNAAGDLGDPIDGGSDVPVPVVQADGGAFVATAIAVGDNHTCAIVAGGGVACWGGNNRGQLGNGSAGMGSATPATVPGLTGATAIAAGDNFTCAVVGAGKVECWGTNGNGQLGNGSFNDANSPALVMLGGAATQVTTGTAHTCVVMADQSVQCWGYNSNGQLGSGTLVSTPTPVPVPGLTNVTAITAGNAHTCVVTNGNVACWGYDGLGQLGIGARIIEADPVSVPIGGPVTAIACGSQHTCAIVPEAGVECWGANTNGQLGNGTQVQENSPGQVMGVPSAIAIAGGDDFTCVVLPAGTVECWGRNPQDELGNGMISDSFVPVAAIGVTGAVDVAAGLSHTCARLSDGGMECWGYSIYGQLANGVADGGVMSLPMPVLGLSGAVKEIALGGDHTCAVMADGTAECWGDNGYGQVGAGAAAGPIVSTPTPVVGLSGVLQIATGVTHTCALLAADGGTVDCWGFNADGELGIPGSGRISSPASVPNLVGVVKLVAGQYHTCAVLTGGGVECWGQNQYAQLGNGAIAAGTPSASPTSVVGLSAPQALSAGYDHTCALVGAGMLCWGQNGQGQLGTNAVTQSTVPLLVQ